MKKVILTLLVSVFMMSCASLTSSGTTKSMDIIGPGVFHVPVLADLEVSSTKVSATQVFPMGTTVENAKNETVRKLLQSHGADVLIEPTFETLTKHKITITVYGFPAKYKNFRSVKEDDLKLLELAPKYLQKAETQASNILVK
jgi:hypothetical protein